MNGGTPLKIVESTDPVAVPRRVALVRPDIRPAVRRREETYVTTFPHLILREVILLQLVVAALAVVALLVDAPLEGIANPVETPNPAKAPWYFLGLQELLHYFPPVVAGVLIPGLVVIAMVVIPYFRTNLEDRGLLQGASRRRMSVLTTLMAAIAAFLVVWRVWAALVPTLALYLAMVLPSLPFCPPPWRRRLVRVTLSDWIMTWFVAVAVILTLIGTFFRGPGWEWIWPWQGGVHL